jgi:hypothetical protein
LSNTFSLSANNLDCLLLSPIELKSFLTVMLLSVYRLTKANQKLFVFLSNMI